MYAAAFETEYFSVKGLSSWGRLFFLSTSIPSS